MRASIENYDRDAAIAAAKEAVDAGLDPLIAMEEGFAKPIRALGEAFDRMEVFLPQLVMAADAMKAGVTVLEEAIKSSGGTLEKKGVVVLGTVEGDIHDIGKTVVMAMLQAGGYEVHDLGVEVPTPRFIQAAEEINANIIGMSALLSTTMLRQRDVVELLRNKGLTGRYFTIVGGAPVTQKWADEIGADAYARDAVEAVKVLDASREKWA
ncbi:MAG TPA: dimethylamine corrinoid protein 3 [Anaerolineae bacterium]|nr:dimethylamine corrinoid protein 3 [Anaerolineae bacterium]